MRHSLPTLLSLLLLLGHGVHGQAVQLPKPDKDGWIKLFRGDNTRDFYSHHKKNEEDGPFPNANFKVQGDTVKVTGGWGHFAFKQVFSHYHIRTEMLHETNGNAGLLLHIREQDPPFDIFPRSLEFQGNNGAGGNGEMGELWTISDVWATVRAKTRSGPCRYDPAGKEFVHTGRLCHGASIPAYHLMKWDTLEALVHGSDSIVHIVNGKVIIKYTQVRIATSSNDYSRPLNSGRIGWQGEGAKVWYRDLRIRLFPGDSLYASLYPASPTSLIRPGKTSRQAEGEGRLPAFTAPSRSGGGRHDVRGRLLAPSSGAPQ